MPTAFSPSIITSKLHTPRLPSRHVPRARLVRQLNQGSDCPVLLICAPAGSGKSTLLAEWVAATETPIGWISVDEDDNDLNVFLEYILTAVQRLFPALPLRTRDMLRSLALPSARALAVSLSNDLDQIDSDFSLILDDYHLITNPAVNEVLALLLQHPPRGLHLVIATRVEPEWPLQALRARGHIAELQFDDLRFTAEESATFLHKALGNALAGDYVAVLHDETEGWAAGLHLLTLITRPEELVSESGAMGNVGAFLLDEVLAGQSPLVQERLTRMAILGRFTSSLCEAICRDTIAAEEHEGWGRAFLAQIDQQNLFLIALDHHNEYFRFHHLFQRFLLDRLRERKGPREIAALHHHAALWFAEQGLLEEAIDHALSANDHALAADLVARFRLDLYNKEQFARLTRLLRLLPIEAKERQAELLLAEARVATMNWRFTEAAVFLDHAQQEIARGALESARLDVAKGELGTLQAILDLWSGNPDRLMNGLQAALPLLPVDADHLRGLAHMGIAAAHWQSGHQRLAWNYVNEQLAVVPTHAPLYATLLQTESFFHGLENDLSELLVSSRRLLSVSQDLDLPDQAALAHYFSGLVSYARNDLDAARIAFALAVDARFNQRLLWWSQAAGMLALTEQALGLPEQAQETLREASDFLLERHAVRVLPNIDAFQAELDRRQGHLLAARAWALNLEPGPLTWAPAIFEPRLAQARAFLLQEDDAIEIERVTALTSELRSYATRVPNQHLLLEVEALTAMLDFRRGNLDAALDRVEDLVSQAFPEGWIRLFVDLGEPMERLLQLLATRRTTSQSVARILEAFPRSASTVSSVPQTGLFEPLTDRELEVLVRLVARDSNKEIASQLYIAPATVKRHTLSIYRKLEVNDRREAVARARDLQLIPVD